MVKSSLENLLKLLERFDLMDMSCSSCGIGLVTHANQLRRVCSSCVVHHSSEEFQAVKCNCMDRELHDLLLRMAEELGFVSRPGGKP